jgi:glucuronokinase
VAIETEAYARAGLLGNPSDGYFGKTISLTVGNFCARVSLEQSESLRVESHEYESSYESVEGLARQITRYGYYGAERLLKAAIKKFFEYCTSNDIKLEQKNFTMHLQSSIPRQVGLGGSSAIVTAAMRGLMEFYGIDIALEILPSLTLDAEKGELGINAGLQDRVIQAYGGCLYMDFNRDLMEKTNCGAYERLHPNLLPPLFLAYKEGLGKVSGHALNPITVGYEQGERLVLDCLNRIAQIAEEGKQALLNRDFDHMFALMNENFDQRSKIMPISEGNREMIDTARRLGASAKFAGSGGSIIGIYKDDDMFEELVAALKKIDATVIKPVVK